MYFLKFLLGLISGMGFAVIFFIFAYRTEMWNWETWKLIVLAFVLAVIRYKVRRYGYSKGESNNEGRR